MEAKFNILNLYKFYKDRTVLVTGNTGFKGSWLTAILLDMGANVIGYSLKSPTNPSLFELCKLDEKITYVEGDVRDYEKLLNTINTYNPEIILHLAAQPIVLDSYKEPKYTYDVNVMGTVNLLEAIRQNGKVKSFLNVTTDKVYDNSDDYNHFFKEDEPLNGYDPYSNSKSCSELLTSSYKKSFFSKDGSTAISTARAGNVIGGGDFSNYRIVPDAIRAIESNGVLQIRNPHSVRPYQHVLEPLFVYLHIAYVQYFDESYSGSYNIGPLNSDCVETLHLAELIKKYYPSFNYETHSIEQPHEMNFLKLDCEKVRDTFSWMPRWNIDKSIEKIIEFTKDYLEKADLYFVVIKQINDYKGE